MENETNEANQNSTFELQSLNPEQYAVSSPPRRTTDLPFFYLTKKKELLDQPIRYEGVDESGRPIRWTVSPNTIIGAPAIDAHKIWHQLIIPTIERHREATGKVPEVLPLGGVRKCLRLVGWTEGGRQARQFLEGLNRIASAWCEADFFVPVQDSSGKTKFVPVKGKFTRLTIYAIGETHLTEEQLSTGKFDFDFDLDATIYLQLHRLEILVQENQDHRYIDNRYMFSVEPTARRWLEIMGPKIFGVVKNAGTHCEVRYSWYIKHHHTLERQTARFRMVEQMNRIVTGHIASGYILKPEYRTIKEPGQEIDLFIRYVPGPMAWESTNRIRASFQSPAEISAPVAIKRRGRGRPTGRPRQRHLHLTPAEEPKPAVIIDYRVIAELGKRGVGESDARQLLASLPPGQPVLDQLDWGDYQIEQAKGKITNPPGFYISLLQRNVPVPSTFETSQAKRTRLEAESARQQALVNQQEATRQMEEEERQKLDSRIAALPEADRLALLAQAKAEFFTQYPHLAVIAKVHQDSAIHDGAIQGRMRAMILAGWTPHQAINSPTSQATPLHETGSVSPLLNLEAILNTPQLPGPQEPAAAQPETGSIGPENPPKN